MMPTDAAAREAEYHAKTQRFALRKLMRVAEDKATTADLKLVEKLRTVQEADDFDALLGDAAVNGLFLRGVIYFGDKA